MSVDLFRNCAAEKSLANWYRFLNGLRPLEFGVEHIVIEGPVTTVYFSYWLSRLVAILQCRH